jgi:hypothetical protein
MSSATHASSVATSWYCISFAYRQVENEDVGGVPHAPVQEDHQDHQQVPDEADNDDESEEDRDDDGHYLIATGCQSEICHKECFVKVRWGKWWLHYTSP